MDTVVCISNDTTHVESDKYLETNHDAKSKLSEMSNFILIIKVMSRISFQEGKPLIFIIKNLNMPFGIPFDPKRFYKDDVYPRRLQRPRFEGLEYTDADIADFEERLGKIYGKGVHRVHIFDFGGSTAKMAEGLSVRILMEHRDVQGQSVFTSRGWRRLFEIRGLLVHELILEFFSTFRLDEAVLGISSERHFLGSAPSYTAIRDPMLRLCHRLIACSIAGRSQAPEKVTSTDLFYLRGMDVRSVNIPYLLARCLRRFASGKKRGAMISRG
ncbi:hypothetical protein Tco_1494855 [Tanacetum coccineum]